MKKRILSLLLVLLMVVSLVPTMAFADDTGVAVDAINFPDDAFRAYVSENCDTDDNGYLSDEEISSVIKVIDVGGRGIASLEGICYFTELQFLSCDNNKLTSLPELPSSLTMLWCNSNQLTLLPELPSSLTKLECRDNQLMSLPELPNSLARLDCGRNQLTSLPELPSGLTDLWCEHNQLTSLPRLPSSLTELDCGGNQLTELPELPSSLTKLECRDNQLMSLPELPNSLARLDCGWNQLTSLPELPSGLTDLWCDNNQLTSLPELPSGLTTLYCWGNQLTSLPELPSGLTRLACWHNQLTEIKLNPSAEYTYINVSDNCLPNKEAVTGQHIEWDNQNFIFGEQGHEHVTELRNAIEPTCTEAGYTGDEVCSICGETIKEGEVIPATGHHFKGNTCPDCGETRSTADTIRAWFQESFNNMKNFFDKIFGRN